MVVIRKRIILIAMLVYGSTMLPSCNKSIEDYLPNKIPVQSANKTSLNDVECYSIGDGFFVFKQIKTTNTQTLVFRCSNCTCPKRPWSSFSHPGPTPPEASSHPDSHATVR